LTSPARKTLLASATFLLVASTLVAVGTTGTSQAASPTAPIIFGAAADNPTQVTADENVLGRHMEGIRDYNSWDSKLFGSSQTWMRDTGHTIFMSIKAQRTNGTKLKFADIAAAAPGSQLYKDMQNQAAQIKAFASPVWIIFNHEPEASGSTASGNGPQFAAAFRKFVTVMRASGVTNAKYAAVFTGYGFSRKDSGNVANYYPGDGYVDAVGADVYNWASCRSQPWTSMATLTDGITAWGVAHPSKPLIIAEWGSVEDKASAGHKAAWIKDTEALFKTAAYHQYVAILQWAGINTKPECSFFYNTSSTAQAAWKVMGNDPSYLANPA
jgi:beta-mannanase